MSLFSLLLLKLIPLYVCIGLGFFAGKVLKVQAQGIAMILLYILNPAVMFEGAYTLHFSRELLMLPLVFLAVTMLLCIVFLFIAKRIWKDSTANIVAYASATGNTGYFGLPVVLAIFGQQALPIVTLTLVGSAIFEQTFGVFIVARGAQDRRKSLRTALLMPALYLFALGLIFNALHIPLGDVYRGFADNLRGAYAVLGMMSVGLAIAGFKKLTLDLRYVGVTFFAKFVCWPVLVFAFIRVDLLALHWFSATVHGVMIVLSLVPLAVNGAVLASAFRVHPEKAAAAVLLATFVALFYLPLVVSVVLK